ncbi:MAG: ABC transporter substrate-binding protein [Sphingomonadaceae bacterium]
MSSTGWSRALLAAALLTAGCGRPDSEAPPLVVDAIGEERAARLVAQATRIGLTRLDSGGRVVPGLAQSWRVSDNGLFIVLRLRPLAAADGRPVRAADIARALERHRTSGTPEARRLLDGVEAVLAPLDEVLEIRLTTPQPELLEILALPEVAVMAEGRGRQAIPSLPGAYREVAEAEDRKSTQPGILLERDEGFFDAGNVRQPRARVQAAEPQAAVQRFRRGETDLVLGGLVNGVSEARVGAPRDALVLERTRATLLLAINHAHPMLGNLLVRQALDRSIDRSRVGRAIYGGDQALPVHALTPPGLSGMPDAPIPDWSLLPLADRQSDAQRRLLEAGLPEGERLQLRLATGDSVEEERAAAALVASWAPIGVDIIVERRRRERHAAAVADGKFEMALTIVEGPVDSPLPFLDWLRCGRNRLQVCLPEADELLARARNEPTLAARMEAIALAERLWLDEVSAIPLIQPLRWSLVGRRVQGFQPNAAGVHPLAFLWRQD